ncbi:CvfD/Ygs/GSP13 family RNA-binding post-transcriptional regulator [Weissella oryzae]|uniref:CvfD/Ygs/GSP13 family RNA-binding post-transcriptional regulator n=1 Tax=Weissella oryzae TaxID=1129792 RepID=UPI000482091A|nr:CvfD/Ygs/GSP13 family RNA-binding post-transcriptional regulator [Weissella oryzae]
MENFRIGQITQGRVTGIQPYGAFVQLDRDTQGLIHISECRSAFIQHVGDELMIGQTVTIVILDIDYYNQKISLSRRAVIDNELLAVDLDTSNLRNKYHHYWTNSHISIGFNTIAENKMQMVDEALRRLR